MHVRGPAGDQGHHHHHHGFGVSDQRRPRRRQSAAIFTVQVAIHYGEAVPTGETATVTVGLTSSAVPLTAGKGTCKVANSVGTFRRLAEDRPEARFSRDTWCGGCRRGVGLGSYRDLYT